MKTKVNLGVGPLPIHPQHLQVMKNLDEWILVDKYVKEEGIQNWDATTLVPIPNDSMELIYASHLLEHISHPQVPKTLKLWYDKLKNGGEVIINVPDLVWAAKQIVKYENDRPLDSAVFTDFFHHNGLLDIVYGTHAHEGERHQSGYTKKALTGLLEDAGFTEVSVEEAYDAHDMGVLLATAKKETKS